MRNKVCDISVHAMYVALCMFQYSSIIHVCIYTVYYLNMLPNMTEFCIHKYVQAHTTDRFIQWNGMSVYVIKFMCICDRVQKQVLSAQNTPIHFIISMYLFFCVGYTMSVSFIEFLRKFCVYDAIFDEVLC